MEPPTEPTPAEPFTCQGRTREDKPCRAMAMAGSSFCISHSGLPRTEAQRQAVRFNRIKHGGFVRGIREEEQALYDDYWECVPEPDPVKRDQVVKALVRRDRVLAREAAAKDDEAHLHAGHAAHALDAAGRALDKVPRVEPKPPEEDPELVGRIAKELSEDPEIFLKRLHPDVQEELRVVLRRAGAIP